MPSTTQTIVYYATGEVPVLALIVLAIVALAWRRRWRAAVELSVASSLALAAALALKAYVGLPRPAGALFPEVGSAFPSGHAAVAAAIGTIAYGVTQTRLCGRGARFLVDLLLVAGVFLVAASRIWLGVHYVPDVVAGAALGALAGLAALALGRFLGRRSKLFRRAAKVC